MNSIVSNLLGFQRVWMAAIGPAAQRLQLAAQIAMAR
jgi:hypothetical protein